VSFPFMFFRFALLITLASVLPLARVQAQADFYINKGNVTNVQVDARNFVNEGRFAVFSEVPWDPQNTVTFTNRGTISGSVGFRFETVEPGFGFRHQAATFYNAPGARIVADDGGGVLPFNQGAFVSALFEAPASFVTINAASVTNRGDVTVGANGLMKLFADGMDLSGGTLIVEQATGSIFGSRFGFFADVTETNFFPSVGVYDLAYGIDIDTNMPVSGILLSTSPYSFQTPFFNITNSASTPPFFTSSCRTSFQLPDAQVFTRDEFVTQTNRVIQVIAVQSGDTNIGVFASFIPAVLPSGVPQGGYLSPIVELRVASTNFRTLDLQTNSLYVFDQLGSHTNNILSSNIVAGTLRPAPIILFRGASGLGELGQPGLPFVDPDVFDNPAYSNRIVTNQYAVYAAEVQSVASRLPALPDVGVTNLPGRVEINATNLKLDNTRIRGEGLITINATNLTGGGGSVIDVPRLNLRFTSTQNLLDLKDMTPDSVERFGGFLQIYSGIWTNTYSEVVGGGTNAVTNTIEVRFQLTAINAQDMHTREAVVAHELKLSSPGNVIYEDNLAVTNLIQIDTPNLTLAEGSRLSLGKGVGFSYTNVVNVLNFTNNGTIQVNELAELRKSSTSGYDSFVNRGNIVAFGTEITAGYFENSGDIISSNSYTFSLTTTTGQGTIFSSDCFGEPFFTFVSEQTEGAVTINAATAKIDGGNFVTLGDVQLNGNVFKVNNHRAEAGGRMVFNVSDILTDTGEQAGNVWTVNNGFAMGARPFGDLLGTEIRTLGAKLAFVDNVWSAEDRGATVAGFTDNVAVGRLVIRGDAGSKFEFIPGLDGSALYVDVLQIEGLQASSLVEFTNRVQLGMNIYYGNIESTNGTFTAERLNRILGPNAPFNFIWVPEWAGPNSGVDVPLTESGPVRRFNRALRESANIDSDGDGLPNRFDPFPFPPEAFGITGITLNPASQAVSFGFTAQSAGTYVIEYTTNLVGGNWQALTQLLQNNPAGGIMSFTDQLRAGDPQRYYRVRKAP
jgi:hypothetical protein